MSAFGSGQLGSTLGAWVDLMARRAIWTVAVFVALTVALLHFAVTNLGINTNTADMISEHLPWRRTFIEFRDSFPELIGNLAIVVDATTADLAEDVADRLTSAMAREPDLFKSIARPGDDPFFRQQGLLFLTPEALEELADNLADAQPMLSQITKAPHLPGLLSLLNTAMEASAQDDDIDIAPLLEQVIRAVEAHNDGRFYQLSWHALMQSTTPNPGGHGHRRIILVKPELEFSRWLAAREVMDEVRRLARELSLDENHGVQIRLTGPVALEYEELKSVSQGAGVAGLLALGMVSLILFAALRSARLVLACVLTLIAGLTATAAFAAFAVGHLNLISIAFAVLYIGLGVDFAIHFALRYRELIQAGKESRVALHRAAHDVGASLVLCALTTSIGFYAFFPTSFSGVSELGLISGTGMFISLAYTLSLLPALLSIMPPKVSKSDPVARGAGPRLLSLPVRHRRAVLIAALVIGLGSLSSLPFVQFDSNPLNLRDPDSESVRTFRELLADTDRPPLTLSVLADSVEAADALAERLKALPEVDRALSLNAFVPGRQEEKLIIIKDLSLILGPDLTKIDTSPQPDTAVQLHAVEQFAGRLSEWQPTQDDASAAAFALQRTLDKLIARLEAQPPAERAESLSRLEDSLLGALPGRLARLRAALSATPVALEDLPHSLVSRWRSASGRYRVEVFPSRDISTKQAAAEFVNAVHAIAPEATGIPVVQLGAGRAVVQAFRQAFLYALVLVSGVLLLLMRSPRDTLFVVTPLLLAASLTACASVLLAIPFNFANIITLPLLLGVGVDNGIHMVHRARAAPPDGDNLLTTSTARAVLYSGLTTIASFGNLAFSQHMGTATMGQLLTLGMIFTLLCTLLLLPAILAMQPRQ